MGSGFKQGFGGGQTVHVASILVKVVEAGEFEYAEGSMEAKQ